MVFYIDYAGIDPIVAGTLFLIGNMWDAFSDPVMASLSERVRTRMGTYRPFLLFGSAFTALTFVLMFWIPPFENGLKIGLMICTLLLFRTSYTIVAIPYSAMATRITYDSKERADYSGARMFFAFSALLIVSLALEPLIDFFSTQMDTPRYAFQLTAALGGLLATLALWSCFSMTREKPLPAKTVQSEKVWRGIWLNIKNNRALRVLLFIILLNTAATQALTVTMVFYIKGHASTLATVPVALTVFAIGTWIMIPVWTYLIRIWGRKKIWVLTGLLHVGIAAIMVFGGTWVIEGIPVQIALFMALAGAHAIIFWALIPDCVEFGQMDSGYRSEAGVYGSVLITQKLSGGFMAFIVGLVLSRMGYEKDSVVSAEQADALTSFIAICPALLILLTIIPILRLPMNRNAHKQIIGQLE